MKTPSRLLHLAGAAALVLAACDSGGKRASEPPPPILCGVLVPGRGVDVPLARWIAGLAAGDFDGDGKLDLVTGSGRGNLLTLLRGAGDGTFEPGPTAELGAGPAWSIAAAHLDGDAHLDLAVVNASAGTVSVLRGAGDGTFHPRLDLATGAWPVHVLAVDLDADGRRDLVVANRGAGTVSVFRGNGDGSFQPRVDHAVLTLPAMVAAGDVNGDGKLDLVVPDDVAGSARVLLGAAAGTLEQRGNVSLAGGAAMIALLDADGDGKLDLVATDRPGGGVVVLPGRGDGSFGPWSSHPTGSMPRALVVVDLDGDGRKDLAVLDAWDETLAVLPGLAGGGFGAATWRANGVASPHAVVAADLDGDGREDLAVVNDHYPSDPLYTSAGMPGSLDAFSVAPFLTRCEAAPEVTPLRATAYRGGPPVRFTADLEGEPTPSTWSLQPSRGTLSASSGTAVDYSAPAAPGGHEELSLSALGPGGTAVAWARVAAATAHPLGSDGAPSGFLEHLPPGYGAGPKAPLLVYLHGSGPEGNGTDQLPWIAYHNPVPGMLALGEWPASLPFVVLAPQQHPLGVSPYYSCFTAAEIEEFLAWALAHYEVDPARVYLAGWSCGGIAIWEYLGWYGDSRVAGVVPVAGAPRTGGQPLGCNLRDVAIWALNGGEDHIVDPSTTRAQMQVLAACPDGSRPAVYTEIERAGHAVAADVFSGAAGFDVYAWMLAHPKP